MGIERIVQVTISRLTRGVTQAGFGIPLIMGPNAAFTGVRTYSSLAGVGADFSTSQEEYLAAAAMFAQTPHPATIKIRKYSTAVVQAALATIATVTSSSSYTININGNPYTFLSGAGATAGQIQAGLVAAINADTSLGVTAAAVSTNQLSLTAANAGQGFSWSPGDSKITIAETTANVGIATDILAAAQEDPTWYALMLTTISDVAVLEAAKTIEAMRRMFVFRSNAAAVKTAATTDIATQLKNKSYTRTAMIWNAVMSEYADAAFLARVLPLTPGSETWAFKDLAGVTVGTFTDSEQAYFDAKNVNFYISLAGLPVTQNGKVASGEYLDIIRGIDQLQARIEQNIFGLLAIVNKVPFTDAGISQVQSQLIGALKSAQKDALVDTYTTTVPKAKDVSQPNKAARTLPDVNFTAVLQGAVHKVVVNGVVTL